MTLRQQRALTISVMLIAVVAAVSLVLYALRGNINLFYTPTQISRNLAPPQANVRVGGMVVTGSVHYSQNHAEVSFMLSDTANQITVFYRGILPDLFREGQGIVAQGKLNSKHQLIADQVLAKHDSRYMPPEVSAAIKSAQGKPHAA